MAKNPPENPEILSKKPFFIQIRGKNTEFDTTLLRWLPGRIQRRIIIEILYKGYIPFEKMSFFYSSKQRARDAINQLQAFNFIIPYRDGFRLSPLMISRFNLDWAEYKNFSEGGV